jgi:hypothetical protein
MNLSGLNFCNEWHFQQRQIPLRNMNLVVKWVTDLI